MSGPARSGRADSADTPAVGDLIVIADMQTDARVPRRTERGLLRRLGKRSWPSRPFFQLFPPKALEHVAGASPAAVEHFAANPVEAQPSFVVAAADPVVEVAVDPSGDAQTLDAEPAPVDPRAAMVLLEDDESPTLFRSAAFDRATQELLAAVGRRDRLVLLTGEAGSGTTTLCRSLIDLVDTRTFTALVTGPFADGEHLLRDVLAAFGVMSDAGEEQAVRSTRHELLVTLRDFLRSLQHLDAHATLFVDEAQTLSPELLQRVCALANIEVDKRPLQVVLVGRPELRTTLAADLHALDGRLAVRSELGALARAEIADYVAFRSARAGIPSILDGATLDALHTVTRGLPGLVDRALEAGSNSRPDPPVSIDVPAPVESKRPVTEPVLPELTLGQPVERRRVSGLTIALTVAAIVLGGLVAWIYGARAVELLVHARIR